jgi:hypothetical protein
LPVDPPELKDGDPLEPWWLNWVRRHIARWNRLSVAAPLRLQNNGMTPPSLDIDLPGDLIPIFTPDGGIPGGSYTSPGQATVTLLVENGNGPGFQSWAGCSTDSPPSNMNQLPCYNIYATAIPGCKLCWAKFRGPYLYVIVGDC